MKELKENDSLREYKVFLSSKEEFVPRVLKSDTEQKIISLLSPSFFTVFLKTSLIHLFFGVLSLTVCHQMNMNPFGTRFSLHHLFMEISGHFGCFLFCGFWFIGLSILASYFFLTDDEIRSLKNQDLSQVLGLSLLSVFGFYLFGANIFSYESILWLIGGVGGGLLATNFINNRIFN